MGVTKAESVAPIAWVAYYMPSDSDGLFGFDCAWSERDLKDYVVHLIRRDRGEPVPDDLVPEVMWASQIETDRRTVLPHIFQACSQLVVSEALANLLGGFDLGSSRLVPTRLLHRDRARPYEGRHLVLDVRARKTAVDVARSPRIRLNPNLGLPQVGSLGGAYLGDIVLTPAALAGPDVWLDPQLLHAIFFSDRLVRAMQAEKMLRRKMVWRCPVAAEH